MRFKKHLGDEQYCVAFDKDLYRLEDHSRQLGFVNTRKTVEVFDGIKAIRDIKIIRDRSALPSSKP